MADQELFDFCVVYAVILVNADVTRHGVLLHLALDALASFKMTLSLSKCHLNDILINAVKN